MEKMNWSRWSTKRSTLGTNAPCLDDTSITGQLIRRLLSNDMPFMLEYFSNSSLICNSLFEKPVWKQSLFLNRSLFVDESVVK